MDKYITYNTTSELHRELSNILLLCLENSSRFITVIAVKNLVIAVYAI